MSFVEDHLSLLVGIEAIATTRDEHDPCAPADSTNKLGIKTEMHPEYRMKFRMNFFVWFSQLIGSLCTL